jgi:uncharacterized protein YjbI with pentapeptide repeats
MLDVVVNLENTILRKSNLERSELTGSILINTSLEVKNLEGVKIQGLDLKKAKLFVEPQKHSHIPS